MVCTYERARFLARCLASVAAAMGEDDELIVVEAGARASEDPVAGLGVDAKRLWCERPGKSRQLNQAAAAAGTEILVMTDDDCVVAPGWVDGMVAALAGERVGAAFGPVRGLSSVPGPPPPQIPPGPAPVEHWVYSHGASMAVRRVALLDAGGFDERLGPGAAIPAGEEADLVLRLLERGWACRVADAPVVEHGDWRDAAQSTANLLAYERGGGALLGAALRRAPARTAKVFVLRLKYQAQLYARPGLRGVGFGPRTTAAFLAGVAAGLRMAPRR